MLNFLRNRRCSFVFTTLLVHTTTPIISTKNCFLYFSQLSAPCSTFTFWQNHPYNHHSSFFYRTSFFHLPIFAYNRLTNLHRQYFPYLSHLANSECVKGWRNYEVFGRFLISPFFFKVWTVITGLAINDFLSLRLRKLVYCRY